MSGSNVKRRRKLLHCLGFRVQGLSKLMLGITGVIHAAYRYMGV